LYTLVGHFQVCQLHVCHTGAKTVIRTVYGNSKCFEVKVDMHQGSAFSPLLFVIVMEAISG